MDAMELMEIARHAAQLGGEELQRMRKHFDVRAKAPADLVTDADLAAQKRIRDYLDERCPGHLFVGEEGPTSDERVDAPEWTWIADPLDGTTNYVHGFPHYATSLGVARSGCVEAGVVYDPVRKECFSAARGRGAFCNGQRLATSGCLQTSRALLAVSLPPSVSPDSPDLASFLAAVAAGRAVRRTGSAALNLAYVASGRLDAFWGSTLKSWDVAAGILLVEEAGGVVTGLDGQPFSLAEPRLLVSASRPLHDAMVAMLNP